MESIALRHLNLLVTDGFLRLRCVYKRILYTVALRDDRHHSQHIAVLMVPRRRLEPDDVVKRLVASHAVRGNVNEADRLRRRNKRGDILIDRQLLHIPEAFLRISADAHCCRHYEDG